VKYAKPPLTLEQQADQLIQRGMAGNREVMIARLQSVSYYRLSGYWFPFRSTDDSFKPGTSESAWLTPRPVPPAISTSWWTARNEWKSNCRRPNSPDRRKPRRKRPRGVGDAGRGPTMTSSLADRLQCLAELYEQMADLSAGQAGAEQLDAVIRQNLEVLGYGE